MTDDPFDLRRFVEAQNRVYPTVIAELRGGRKRSHWIWFVFPQLSGLGSSATAERFGIASLAEARAFLAHDVLGPRLHECARLLLAVHGRSIEEIVGRPDCLKVRSSMTLFAQAAAHPGGSGSPQESADFTAVLDRYFDGIPDPVTAARVGAGS